MSQGNGSTIADARRDLIERLACSPYLNRSARLRDLLLYLSDRVLAGEAGEIHEQEVGHKVFGRALDYDTSADNIVRVHASTLRKRLEQYFATEGTAEPLIVEIPKGNYAPVFRERRKPEPVRLAPLPAPRPPRDWRIWALTAAALAFALSTMFLIVREMRQDAVNAPPEVRRFWSQIFRPGRPTDIVLDDSAVALYQELTGKPLPLAEYFDRDYLRGLATAAESRLDARTASKMVLRRQSSYASASFFWKLTQMPVAAQRPTVLRFARDYSFRDLKTNSAILLGNASTNPWVQPFQPKLGIRWQYDESEGIYYPLDSWNGGKSYRPGGPGAAREGYFSVALLPNLAATGNVLIVSGTGGSALNSGADFLADDRAVSQLRAKLPRTNNEAFPYFEALLRMRGRGTLPRDAAIVVCRPAAR